jgi:nitrogen fixation protein NifU and related proteins
MNAGSQEVKLTDLYQEVILDHNRNPRNFGKLEGATAVARGVNPLCGDHFDIYLANAGGTIGKIKFEGDGCAISKASASMMTQAVEGKTDKEAGKLAGHFIHLLTDSATQAADREQVGKLKFFEGVKNFPIRVKCATLAWRALEEALKGNVKEVSTE